MSMKLNKKLGAFLYYKALERWRNLNPFPVSTSVQEMIDKANSKPTIRYMTEAEVMEYLISTKNRK